jgi:hypothetical protein
MMDQASNTLRVALLFDGLKRLVRTRQDGRLAGVDLPASDRDVDVMRVDFQRAGLAAGPLGGDQNRPAPPGTVLDRVRHQGDRFDGRVHCELIQTAWSYRVDASIGPDICSVTSMLPQLKVVDVWFSPALPDEDQFVLRTIKSSHPGIRLGPDTQVLQFGVYASSCSQHLPHMSPVHADLMDGAVDGVLDEASKGGLEKVREFSLAHFAGPHHKLAVTDFTEPADIAVNRDIERRIRKNELSLGPSEKTFIGVLLAGVGAEQSVITQ